MHECCDIDHLRTFAITDAYSLYSAYNQGMIKKLSQKVIYKDEWHEFFLDEVEFPDGSKGTYAWVNRKKGVAVAVLTKDKKILLHKEFRYVINDYSWEIQGGGMEDDESAEQAALRELQEEAGITASLEDLHKMGEFYPLNSFNTEKVAFFMIIIDHKNVTTQGSEASESIEEQRFVSFLEALKMIDTGIVNDALTAHAIQMAIRKFEEKRE